MKRNEKQQYADTIARAEKVKDRLPKEGKLILEVLKLVENIK